MARPAAGAGRQAQVARLLVVAGLGACANQGPPPGGPPDKAPPQVVRFVPESGAVLPGFKGDAVIQFDEVIDEMPGGGARGGGGGGGGGAAPVNGLAGQIVLSPVAGDVHVSWHRSAIHVKPAEGWKPNRVYHLELLPGIVDLRRNILKQGKTAIFSTGAPLPHAALAGTVLQWVEQRALAGAVIRAAPLPDTVAYVTVADSAGDFHLSDIPRARYRVWAIQDQNSNRQLDRREPFDSTTVAIDSSGSAVLWVFAHDTVGPRIRGVDAVESLACRIQFTAPLDPRRPLDAAQVRLYALPDTTPVAVRALFTTAQYDSLQAKARASADSVRRAKDTTARRDTVRAGAARPPAAARRAPALPGEAAPRAAAADTTKVRQLLKQRPVPFDRVVLQAARPLTPGSKYLIRFHGATNLNGAAADAQGVLTVPVPKPAARDTTRAPRDTSKSP